MVLATALGGFAHGQTPPPASAFGRQPGIFDAAISPNGQTIAILGGTPEVRTLSFATIDKPDLPTLALGNVEAVGIRWAGDGYALARIARWERLEAKSAYRFERNLAISPQGRVVSQLLQGDVSSQVLVSQPVIGVTQGPSPRAVVLGLQMSTGPDTSINTHLRRKGEDAPFVLALWNVDPATGKGVIQELGNFDTAGWDVDSAGETRVRRDVDNLSHKYSLYGRAKGVREWTAIFAHQDLDSAPDYLGYSTAEDAVYLGYETNGAVQVTRRGLADGVAMPVGKPVTGATPSLIRDEARGSYVGIAAGEEQPVQWLDPEIEATAATLTKVFKGKRANLMDWSADRSRFLVRVTASMTPPTWYLFDRSRKELSPIGEAYPELNGAALGSTQRIIYKARDGLDIEAFLTLPPGAGAANAKLPLIVLPHAGLAARDEDGFDWLTQFLATRGYAVLRPQFRGSAGFGSAFEKAGRGEWSGKIQTDLLDGIAAVAASGQIDPGRVCIVGAAFGGYSALAGAALHPEAYRCAASVGGISDLAKLSDEVVRPYGPDAAGLRSLREAVSAASLDKLREGSPVAQAAKVRAPILLIHADQDTVVLPEQSKFMADALKAAGKSVEYVTLVGDDHYLMQSATRTQMLETLGAFLAKNLP
ncbi:S9 family peptidase, partial [Phenylobacterium aquaticum]|uniref:alpha/beta hydrolase family protein n=1 Tax=Phenylobacterium aquaticum TaxID=1763816 RepID=UPI0026E96EAA